MVIKDSSKFFYANDGSVLRSESEMLNWMRTSSDDSFAGHVNTERNDFAPWIAAVIKDKTLARSLNGLHSRDEIIEAIESRIRGKEKKKNMKKNLIAQIKEAVDND